MGVLPGRPFLITFGGCAAGGELSQGADEFGATRSGAAECGLSLALLDLVVGVAAGGYSVGCA